MKGWIQALCIFLIKLWLVSLKVLLVLCLSKVKGPGHLSSIHLVPPMQVEIKHGLDLNLKIEFFGKNQKTEFN